MRNLILAFAATSLLMTAVVVQAGQPAGFWTAPAISGYGKMHYLPDSAYKPSASQTYKIVIGLSQGPKSPGQVNPSLEHVARLVNLYAASGVPLDHLEFVAVAYGKATPMVLNDKQYRAAFGMANPNLPLIGELRKAGVDVAVCGQAVAEHKFHYDWVDSSVTLTLSAMTTITTLESQGYGLLSL